MELVREASEHAFQFVQNSLKTSAERQKKLYDWKWFSKVWSWVFSLEVLSSKRKADVWQGMGRYLCSDW